MHQDKIDPKGSVSAGCQIRVNEQAVTLVGEQHRASGIKRAAIEQGVAIEEDFVLSLEYEPQKTRVLVEEEELVVKDDTCFTAVADDDNS